MGTNDSYAKAEPDEPMFVLLARDPSAPHFVRHWATQNKGHQTEEKLKEAFECAAAMVSWRLEHRSGA
jgi:hypothetical protein